ncbi:teichuronic acid biosynthesis glycosyltransferase TuaH [Cryobacterium sp. MP_M3]|uniref:hypothetical protein n=1 Tax=unclassified Cryobacterium TaxID=2649013 RepID=UPI0018CA0C35|nr:MULTISPECIES: hypothetical protein [unclassified Cryobacterium]MBG6057002.1 teichuronic acid biosynthesis glycosyltransferase TuaH [Cryobacterium sp. MP_M3]
MSVNQTLGAAQSGDTDGRPKILFLSHTVDGGDFRVGSHHLARELSLIGCRVAHVSTPLSLLHLLARRGEKRRRDLALGRGVVDEFGTLHSVPLFPFPLRLSANRRGLRRHIERIGFWKSDYILIDQPLMSGVLDEHPPGLAVYRPTDEYPEGIASRRQLRLLKNVVAVVATSQTVLQALHLGAATPQLVLENGVEFSRFAAPQSRGARSGLVYAGALDHRFDWPLVIALAEAFPEESVRLIGPLKSVHPELPSNVILTGPLDYSVLSSELNSAVVGILPFNSAVENAGRSPMKFYEYLAAGLHVVAPATATLSGRTESGALMYSSTAEAIAAVRQALALPSPNEPGIAHARERDWSGKARQLLTFLEALRG